MNLDFKIVLCLRFNEYISLNKMENRLQSNIKKIIIRIFNSVPFTEVEKYNVLVLQDFKKLLFVKCHCYNKTY